MKKHVLWLTAIQLLVSVVFAADIETRAVQVSTSLPIYQRHVVALAFDGNAETWFGSARAVADGDDFLATLPEPMTVRSIEILTGKPDGKNALAFGALETSADESNFTSAAVFRNGVAKAERLSGKLLAFRIRVTGSDGNKLAIREIKLKTEQPLPPIRFVTRIEAHTETAREAANFARKAKAICEEWYPKLYEMFDTPDGPPPRSVIKLYFQNMDGVAYTSDNLYISNKWVTKQSPNDYGMVIHELFHVVQSYNGGGEGWLTEGLADYVRHRLFEPQAPLPRIDPDKASYHDAYKTTATFLEWLEDNKSKGIVLKLNAAARARKPVVPIFEECTGQTLDALWKEFTDALRKKL